MVAMTTPQKDKKTGIYYYRKVIPEFAREHFHGKREYKRSLHTRCPKEAKSRQSEHSSQVEAIIESARTGKQTNIHGHNAYLMAQRWLQKALEDDRKLRESGEQPEEESNTDYEHHPYEINLEMIDEYRERGAVAAFVLNDIRDTLLDKGIALSDAQIKANDELIEQFARAKHLYYRTLAKRHRGHWEEQDFSHISTPHKPSRKSTSDTPLDTIIERWEKQADIAEKTIKEYKKGFSEFKELHGPLSVEEINPGHIRDFKDNLEINGKKAGTINKKLNGLQSLLGYAKDDGYISNNPASGFRVKDKTSKRGKREPFTEDELKKLFSTPVYSQHERPKAGNGETAKWLPLLALYTGGRLNELASLRLEDINKYEGIDCLELETAKKGRKESYEGREWRLVPIHSDLVTMGFLEYVDRLKREGKTHLFYELPSSSDDNKSASNWAKWWHRYSRSKKIIEGEKKVFHSFRHTFISKCRNEAMIAPALQKAMTGHSLYDEGIAIGSAEENYGAYTTPNGRHYHFSPKALKPEIEKIDFKIVSEAIND